MDATGSDAGAGGVRRPDGLGARPSLPHLADVLPVAVVVIDRAAEVRYANQRASDLIGRTGGELVGSSALDLVDEGDLEFAMRILEFAPHTAPLMGPALIRFVDAAGVSHTVQLWAYDAPASLGVDGYVLVLTGESTNDLLVAALASIDVDEDVDRTLEAICRSAQGDPLDCRAAMLVPQEAPGEPVRFSVVGDWPLPAALVDAENTPWRMALTERRPVDVVGLDDPLLSPGLVAEFEAAGLEAAWSRPVFGPSRGASAEVSAVYVLWPDDGGPASPNQDRYLQHAVQLARLAFEEVLHRRELERAALRDGLTGVANRRAFRERLSGSDRSHDVLYIDLDHFKEANDTYGHEVGDQILTQVAARISHVIRREDVLYRTGGDEFVVICDGIGMALDEHGRLAARIIERLSTPFDCGGQQVRIGATVGIATGTERSLPETVRAADKALYEAKDRGRGCWQFASRS